jgi:hypothetical protein
MLRLNNPGDAITPQKAGEQQLRVLAQETRVILGMFVVIKILILRKAC